MDAVEIIEKIGFMSFFNNVLYSFKGIIFCSCSPEILVTFVPVGVGVDIVAVGGVGGSAVVVGGGGDGGGSVCRFMLRG